MIIDNTLNHNPLSVSTMYNYDVMSHIINSTTRESAWVPLDKYVLINDRVYQMFVFRGLNVGYADGVAHFKVTNNKYIEVFEDLPILDKEEALDKYPESFL